jgi:hypothetical protein
LGLATVAAAVSTLGAVAIAPAVAAPVQSPSTARPAIPRAADPWIVEHYHGRIFRLTPRNWHGAKDCVVVEPTNVYCFDTADEMNAFTATPAANPVEGPPTILRTSGTCSGYTKIWNGVNWTNRGFAFHDWGFPQSLAAYYPGIFYVRSWFSDGQRGYPPSNCNGRLFSNSNGSGGSYGLPSRAESRNMPAFGARSIWLYQPGTWG